MQITGGQAVAGAGLRVAGFVNLTLSSCKVNGNTPTPLFGEGGTGAGLAALNIPFGNTENDDVLGPNVTINNSIIADNQTGQNDDPQTQFVADTGGGMFIDAYCSLTVNDSVIIGNFAENNGGGIYFGGGNALKYGPSSVDEFDFVSPGPRDVLHASFLRISDSVIAGNSTRSILGLSNGGGLFIANSTGAMISNTSFDFNSAYHDGGGVYMTTDAFTSPEHFDEEFVEFRGHVVFIGCTFEGNTAGSGDFGDPPIIGNGGALRSLGIGNKLQIINSTISANAAEFGSGGGLSLASFRYDYRYFIDFDIDYNLHTIKLADIQVDDFGDPNNIRHDVTRADIYNTTITGNIAFGKVDIVDGQPPVLSGGRGGGVAVEARNLDDQLDGQVVLISTIVAANHVFPLPNTPPISGSGPDIWAADDSVTLASGPVQLGGSGNLIGITDSGQFIVGMNASGTLSSPLDPGLQPLANNGGLTKTHKLLRESEAVDRGGNPLDLDFDQVGHGRELSLIADIGAYEHLPVAVGIFNVVINDGVPVQTDCENQRSRIFNVAVYFEEQVSLPANAATAFSLVRIHDQVSITLLANVVNLANQTKVTLTWDANSAGLDNESLGDGRYTLTVISSDVTVAPGGFFDGNGNNANDAPNDNYVLASDPAPLLPSGIFRLFGDGNGDGDVDQDDFILFRNAFTQTGVEFLNVWNWDLSTAVDQPDFIAFRNHFNATLP